MPPASTAPGAPRRLRFRTNAAVFSGSSVVSQVIILVKGLLVRRLLPPEVFGFWSFAAVVHAVVSSADAGFTAAAVRDLPVAHGRGDREEAYRVRSTALTCTLVQNLAVAVFGMAFLLAQRGRYQRWELIAGLVAVLLSALASVHLAYAVFLGAAQAFVALSVILVVGAAFDAAAAPIATYWWGLSGLMTAAVVHACFVGAVSLVAGRALTMRVSLRVDARTARHLFFFGSRLRLAELPSTLSWMLPSFWVARFLSTGDLALFALANAFAIQLADISMNIGSVYTARFLEQGGQGVSRAVMSDQLKRFLFVQLLVVMPLLCWTGSAAVPFVITHFIGRYAAAVPVFLVLAAIGFFYVVNSGLTNPWLLDRRLSEIAFANVLSLAAMTASVALCWYGFQWRSLEAIAYATIAGHALCFIYLVMAVGRDLWPMSERIEIVVTVAAAAAWTLSVLALGQPQSAPAASWIEDVVSALRLAAWTLALLAVVPAYGLVRSRARRPSPPVIPVRLDISDASA